MIEDSRAPRPSPGGDKQTAQKFEPPLLVWLCLLPFWAPE
jgi:hypothetical protein